MQASHRERTRRRSLLAVEKALVLAMATATFVGPRPIARAVCADGSTFPAGGYIVGQPPIVATPCEMEQPSWFK